MPEVSQEESLVALAWDKIELKTRLPENMEDFFEQLGMTARRQGCRRACQRFYIRGQAIVRRDETYLGVYTADASRTGIRFLSPIELPPKERVRIRLPNTKEFQVELVRCQRLDEACYDCGAVFVMGK